MWSPQPRSTLRYAFDTRHSTLDKNRLSSLNRYCSKYKAVSFRLRSTIRLPWCSAIRSHYNLLRALLFTAIISLSVILFTVIISSSAVEAISNSAAETIHAAPKVPPNKKVATKSPAQKTVIDTPALVTQSNNTRLVYGGVALPLQQPFYNESNVSRDSKLPLQKMMGFGAYVGYVQNAFWPRFVLGGELGYAQTRGTTNLIANDGTTWKAGESITHYQVTGSAYAGYELMKHGAWTFTPHIGASAAYFNYRVASGALGQGFAPGAQLALALRYAFGKAIVGINATTELFYFEPGYAFLQYRVGIQGGVQF
ncbi:MAG: hypothetical protein LDLANPLL_01433 [Turneriella sp.]|nr:hypothetical protein [Turneriella sp.]